MTISIKFYTKPKCSLCDEVRILLDQIKKEYPFEVEEVNILDDPDNHIKGTPMNAINMKFLFSYPLTYSIYKEK